MLSLPWKNRDTTIPTCVYKWVSYKGAQFPQYLMKVKPTLQGTTFTLQTWDSSDQQDSGMVRFIPRGTV